MDNLRKKISGLALGTDKEKHRKQYKPLEKINNEL